MDKILLAASSLCFVGAFVYVLLALRNSQERTPLANLLLMGAGFLLQCFVLHLRGQFLSLGRAGPGRSPPPSNRP